TATFELTGWNEKPLDEGEVLPKMTRASVSKKFQGDVEGESKVEYLMMYRDDGTATYVGLERITGQLAGKRGSFVLLHEGVFEDGVSKTTWTVVPGSGTGELAGLKGKGGFASGHAERYPITLEYELA
ncbi:MAG TPA: DUF3224 domain-containing protein, partial [Gemmatimonadales bacterium]